MNIPKSYYLTDFPVDLDLKQYVLKPLFSYAGHEVDLYPKQETIHAIADKHKYILQQKVSMRH
jgi:glutathionylspermidine synthase